MKRSQTRSPTSLVEDLEETKRDLYILHAIGLIDDVWNVDFWF